MDSRSFFPETRVYTDIQGLKELQYQADSPEAKQEVAQQFEALLVQMMMHSMRDANKAFAGDNGLFGSQAMDMYQDMFDKQMSLSMSNANLGFAKMVEENIDRMQSGVGSGEVLPGEALFKDDRISPTINTEALPVVSQANVLQQLNTVQSAAPAQKTQESFATQEEFVKKLWPSAKAAANFIGTTPEILLAQAALETNWGKNVLPQGKTDSSHNLFNIKADNSWNDQVVHADSLEQRNGVLVKEKSRFRSYGSYDESFNDYANFLKQNDRYAGALNKAPHPEQFVYALQDAGYATDQHYAHKIMKIFSSHNFQDMVTKAKQTT